LAKRRHACPVACTTFQPMQRRKSPTQRHHCLTRGAPPSPLLIPLRILLLVPSLWVEAAPGAAAAETTPVPLSTAAVAAAKRQGGGTPILPLLLDKGRGGAARRNRGHLRLYRRASTIAGASRRVAPFFRSEGLRGGVGGAAPVGSFTAGSFHGPGDSLVNRNIWKGDGMAYDYEVLDDLQPVAPMDRIQTAIGPSTLEGNFKDALFVPPYIYPDQFPHLGGKACDCPVSKDKTVPVTCECVASPGPAYDEVNQWSRAVPLPGGGGFRLLPADLTYSGGGGDYFSPEIRRGIVAPADRMPPGRYPNQAPLDVVWPVPAVARKDRLGQKYARYIDQVEFRARECDTVSAECTVPCSAGDEVEATFGNTRVKAKVVTAFVGNTMSIEIPLSDSASMGSVECEVTAGCTIFRPCFALDGQPCVEKEAQETYDAGGDLERTARCPFGTAICRSLQQVVSATYLTREVEVTSGAVLRGVPRGAFRAQRACRAAPPDFPATKAPTLMNGLLPQQFPGPPTTPGPLSALWPPGSTAQEGAIDFVGPTEMPMMWKQALPMPFLGGGFLAPAPALSPAPAPGPVLAPGPASLPSAPAAAFYPLSPSSAEAANVY